MTETFNLSGINYGIANALRRVLIAEIPSWAFDEITIEENMTPFSSEYISHRLSLIPLNNEIITEAKTFTLEAKAAFNSVTPVLSDEIVPKGIAHKDICIVELKGSSTKQENIRITATIAKKTHKDAGAQFSAICVAAYESINEDNTTFQFIIENRGLWTTTHLIAQAFDIIIKKLELLIEFPESKISYTVNDNALYKISINDEDDTIGNLIQMHLLKKVEFIAYHRPHPLENHIVVSIKDSKDGLVVFKKALSALVDEFKVLKTKVHIK